MIDIRTVMLLLAIGSVSFAMLVAAYARTATDSPAMRIWTWGKLLQGGAYLVGWLRPDMPYVGGALATNTLAVLGIAFELAAYCNFFGIPRWRRRLVGGTVLALLIEGGAILGGISSSALPTLMSVIIAGFVGPMAFLLLRPAPSYAFLQRTICINNAILFIALGWRAYTGLVSGSQSLFTSNTAQSFAFLMAYLLMIVNGFGFLLLCKEKDDRAMQRLATVDCLTGLVNRRAFFDLAQSARMLAVRLRQPIALLMVDIDHFKRLNDRFGHATGDEALCLFAATARESLRDHDIMGRLGGEEFAVILPGTDLEGARQAAERLRVAVAGAVLATGATPYAMTVSIGVAAIGPLENINAALARADHALYAAKSAGRNRVEVGELRLARAQGA